MRVTAGVRSEEVRQNGAHVLFVEGHGEESFDVQIITELFNRELRVETLGPSFSIKSVAQALYPFHPKYYFLIDRDHHHDDKTINKCWKNFPDPETQNLLIWKYRELENYFLEPDYLMRSENRRVGRSDLEDKIKTFCQERLYLDAANYVITSIREGLKKNWVQIFTNPNEFGSRTQALERLHNTGAFNTFKDEVANVIGQGEIERRFDETLNKMTNGSEQLEFGNGRWLEMIQGKKVFSQLVDSECFQVEDSGGNYLQGREKVKQVAKSLLRLDITKQPEDFQELKRLIEKRLKS